MRRRLQRRHLHLHQRQQRGRQDGEGEEARRPDGRLRPRPRVEGVEPHEDEDGALGEERGRLAGAQHGAALISAQAREAVVGESDGGAEERDDPRKGERVGERVGAVGGRGDDPDRGRGRGGPGFL